MLSRRISTRLCAAAAAAPLAFMASQAMAQTTVATPVAAQVRTSEAGNIVVTVPGSITTTDAPAIVIDSDNTVEIQGTINTRDSAPAGVAGVLSISDGAPRVSGIAISGNIIADDSSDEEDDDGDGDLDGPFVDPASQRYGIRVTGDSPFVGNILQTQGGITVEGANGSAGISVETALTGNLSLDGAIGVQGDDSFGVRAMQNISGDVNLSGIVQAQGESAIAVSLEGAVGGGVRVDGSISASGFRYTNLSNVPGGDIDELDADDLLIGGTGLRIAGSVGAGVVIEAAPADLDADDADEDDDGVADALETRGSVISAGSAPAIVIGSSSDIVLGNAGAAARDQYGLIVRGDVQGSGVFDGIDGAGIRIGGMGGAVNTTGGISVTGTVIATAFEADALALDIGSGVTAPVLHVSGNVSAGVNTDETVVGTSTAVRIASGSAVSVLNNDGLIRAGVTGPEGAAFGIVDQSGTLRTINNTGGITALLSINDPQLEAEGVSVALDLSSATGGVTLSQTQASGTTRVPTIVGDILLGAGAFDDTVTISAGAINGALSFGGGSDSFTIDGDSTVARAALDKGAGALAVNINGGQLIAANTDEVDLSVLNVDSDATLTFTVDPQNENVLQRATLLDVAGMATFGDGAQIGLAFESRLGDPTIYTVLRAGDLVNNGISDDLLGQLPFIYNGELSVIGDELQIAVRRSTLDELGLADGRAAAYEAFYQAFDSDPQVEARLLAQRDEEGFNSLYTQFLPDYGGGPFRALATTTRAAMAAQAETGEGLQPGEPRSWLQEVGANVKQESIADVPYQTGGFGLVGGVERPLRGGRTYIGFAGSYQSSEIRNGNRAIGSYLAASAVTGSLYWRQHRGNVVLDTSGMAGVAWFDSVRRIQEQNAAGAVLLSRQAEADWRGYIAAARLGAAYNFESGRYYARPEVSLDAVYLSEGGYTETGGGNAVNLRIASRTNYEASAEASVVMGAQFGRSFKWGPELRLGYRAILAAADGETTGQFAAVPGSVFVIPGVYDEDGLFIIRATLRGEGAYANLAIESGADIGSDYQAYTVRFLVRYLF